MRFAPASSDARPVVGLWASRRIRSTRGAFTFSIGRASVVPPASRRLVSCNPCRITRTLPRSAPAASAAWLERGAFVFTAARIWVLTTEGRRGDYGAVGGRHSSFDGGG